MSQVQQLVSGQTGALWDSLTQIHNDLKKQREAAEVERMMTKLALPIADPSPQVRERAILAITKLGPRAKLAITWLHRALKDENENVRQAAKAAIAAVGPISTMELLIYRVSDEKEPVASRKEACLQLANEFWFESAARRCLEDALTTPVRDEAVSSLQTVNDKTVVIKREGNNGQLAFSPNGKLLAWSHSTPNANDNERKFGVTVWDRDAKKPLEIETLEATRSLAFFPDGASLATCHASDVRVWNAKTGALKSALTLKNKDKGKTFTHLAISSNGKWITACGTRVFAKKDQWQVERPYFDYFVCLWDLEKTDSPLVLEHPKEHVRALHINNVSFAPDGTSVAVAASDNFSSSIYLCDVNSGKITDVRDHVGQGELRFWLSSDQKIAGLNLRNRLVIWNRDPLFKQGFPELPKIFQLMWKVSAISLDARLLAVEVSRHKNEKNDAVESDIELWSLLENKRLAILSGHTGWISDIAFDPQGHWLATSGQGSVRLWDLRVFSPKKKGE